MRLPQVLVAPPLDDHDYDRGNHEVNRNEYEGERPVHLYAHYHGEQDGDGQPAKDHPHINAVVLHHVAPVRLQVLGGSLDCSLQLIVADTSFAQA